MSYMFQSILRSVCLAPQVFFTFLLAMGLIGGVLTLPRNHGERGEIVVRRIRIATAVSWSVCAMSAAILLRAIITDLRYDRGILTTLQQWGEIKGRYIGTYMAKRFQHQCLLLIWPDTGHEHLATESREKTIKSLREGMQGALKEVGFAFVGRVGEYGGIDIHAQDYCKVLSEYPHADVVLSFAPLPEDIDSLLTCLNNDNRQHKLIFSALGSESFFNIEPFVRNGAITAVVVVRRGPFPISKEKETETQYLFEQRFSLIDMENIDSESRRLWTEL